VIEIQFFTLLALIHLIKRD